MYTSLKKFAAGIVLISSFTACEDGFKSYANDNTARPTVPDNCDRNIGDDGTSDKLIDPFYKGAEKGKKQNDVHHNDALGHH